MTKPTNDGPRGLTVRPNGDVLMYGVIGDAEVGLNAETVIREIDKLGNVPQLTVRLNSYGGYVYEGLAIYNYLIGHPARVVIQVDGLAASMASVLAMAGRDIVMAESSMMMIHNPWDIALGDAEALRKQADVLDKLRAQIAGIYAARTGQTVEAIIAMMDAETWLSADDALAGGFATAISQSLRAAAMVRFDATLFKHPPRALIGAANPPSPGNGAGREAAQAAEQDERNVIMSAKTKPDDGSAVNQAADPNKITATEPQAAADPQAIHAAVKTERERGQAIRAAVKAAKLDDAFADQLVQAGISIDTARARIIDKLAAEDGPEPRNQSRAVVISDQVDRFRQGAELALLARAGMGGERNEFAGLTLRELARESLNLRNIATRGMNPMQMIGVAFAPMAAGGYHGTSDFANVLANVANKAMLKGYDEAEETFQKWTSKGSLTDFKPTSRVDLGMFGPLAKIEEGAEYTYGTIGDRGVTIQLATYGKLFSITRQTIINDDIGAFTRGPQKLGRAAIRTVGNLPYAVLTANANMADGKALFHTDHKNLAGTTGAPSTATLDALRTAMGTQKDPDGFASGGLNISPAYILTPKALEGTAKTALESDYDTAKGDKRVPNSVKGMAEVVADARLDAASTTAWYGAADPNRFDTIEVAYLDGVDKPYLETRDGWNVDGVEMKVRIDAGVQVLDHRGLYKNAG